MSLQFKVDISAIREQIGQTLEQTALIKLPEFNRVEFPDAWRVHTRINHTYDGYFVTGQAEGSFTATCDRCLEPYTDSLIVEFNEVFASNKDLSKDYEVVGENEDIHYFSGDEIDLTETLRDSVLLALPMKNLCAMECKGLCAQCGVNLNNTTCNCENVYPDPRLAKLGELFNLTANEDKGGGSDGQPKE